MWQIGQAGASTEPCQGWMLNSHVCCPLPPSLILFCILSDSCVGWGERCFSEQAHSAGRRGAGSSSGKTHYSFAETGGGREGCRWEREVCVGLTWMSQALNTELLRLIVVWCKQQRDSRLHSSCDLLYSLIISQWLSCLMQFKPGSRSHFLQ